MDLELAGKVCVVTGASDGIGRGICLALAREGAHVVMLARRPDALESAREKVAQLGSAECHPLDATDLEGYERLLKDVASRHGRLDGVVNNAAAATFTPIEAIEIEDWRNSYKLNIDAPMWSMRTAFPIMREAGGGAIVNIGSIMGAIAQAGAAPYGSAKAGLVQLTNIAAVEGAPHNIRVNLIQVGSIITEGTDGYRQEFPELAAKVEQTIPMKRWGVPAEIADTACFLLSARSSFTTGANIAIDGGLGVVFPY